MKWVKQPAIFFLSQTLIISSLIFSSVPGDLPRKAFSLMVASNCYHNSLLLLILPVITADEDPNAKLFLVRIQENTDQK